MLILTDSKVEPLNMWIAEWKYDYAYKEPILRKEVVKIIHLVCTALEQDAHVFIMSVDLLENYLNEEIEDLLLIIIVIVFICSKLVGEQSELKIKHIMSIYENMTSCKIKDNIIIYTEILITNRLKNSLPLTSMIDDLKLLYSTYLEPMNLKISCLDLCVNILELIYINKYDFFYNLKKMYTDSDTLDIFKCLMCSKLYLICGVILASLTVTKYQNFFDLEKITSDFSLISSIHKDHYLMLSKIIVELLD